jgi:7-cyano-7-deazaguanine synthase in queuosine biosynthesis
MSKETTPELRDHIHTRLDGSWWEYDGNGISLCRVCESCREVKLSRYRPEILRGYTQADVDEPIEPEL